MPRKVPSIARFTAALSCSEEVKSRSSSRTMKIHCSVNFTLLFLCVLVLPQLKVSRIILNCIDMHAILLTCIACLYCVRVLGGSRTIVWCDAYVSQQICQCTGSFTTSCCCLMSVIATL